MGTAKTELPDACIWCGFSERGASSLGPSTRFRSSVWPTWHCGNCGVDFIWPIPSEEALREYYSYASYAARTYAARDRSREKRVAEFVELLTRIESVGVSPRRLLDVGCSTGELIEVAQSRGWKCTGIEIDAETAAVARHRTKAEIRIGTVSSSLTDEDEFDCIVMSHSLEHSPTPKSDFQTSVRHLSPRGHILLRVPNADSRSAGLMGRAWYWFTPPIHITFFDRESIRRVASECRLSVVWWSYKGEGWLRFLSEFALMPLVSHYRLASDEPASRHGESNSLRRNGGRGARLANQRRALLGVVDRLSRILLPLRTNGIIGDSEVAVLLVRD